MKHLVVVLLAVALASGCSLLKGKDVSGLVNVVVDAAQLAEKTYTDCLVGTKEAVDAIADPAEKAKASAAGVKACVDKYADDVADLLVKE